MLNGLIRYKQVLLLPLAVIVVFGVPALAASVLAFDDVGLPQIDLGIEPSGPVAKNEPIVVTAVYTDPTGSVDVLVADWEWGDGSTSTCNTSSSEPDCTLTEPPQGEVTGSHTYNESGIYEIDLTVTAIDSDVPVDPGQAETNVVVYDPTGGFVTGGGWIDSPAEAYVPDPTLTGKANFGFVSKYKKGADKPTGNTEFQFHAGDLNFHSTSYQWLVVNQDGTNAQFKGEGTINGEGNYKFMLWAKDLDPDYDDTFRIKIWYEDDGEKTVYDNGFDQPIGGGNIIIHKAK